MRSSPASTARPRSWSPTTAAGSSTASIASLEALPEVVEAVGDRAEVYLDGGVRRGSDVVMALALGARAVLVGRPAMYGLAFGGAKGVQQVLEILRDEVENALALLGCRSPAEVTRAHVTPDVSGVSLAELTRNAVHVLPEGALEAKLALGRPLRVKLGIDVTAPDVTLGNGIPLQRMAAFQRAGHVGVLIVGDYTTRIGDPSGRSAARPILSDEEIDANAKRFVEQASTIIDPERTEVRFNGEWLAKLDFAEILRLTRTTTVAQILERDDFAKRQRAREPISVSELLYPLMQAYDSVAVEADVELGGTDQLYNLLAGREVMQAYGLEPQVALTVEYLVSWDGAGMSASRGNYIGLEEDAERAVRQGDAHPGRAPPQWYRLVMESDDDPLAGDPMSAKLALARWIVARSHGEEAAADGRGALHARRARGPGARGRSRGAAAAGRSRFISRRCWPSSFGLSTSEARRLISQGGVKVDGAAVGDLDLPRERAQGSARTGRKAPFRPLSADREALVRATVHERPAKCATIPRSPERVAQESCHSTNWSAFERTHTTSVVPPRSLCRESEVFCCRQQSGSVFENSTA